MLAHIPSNSVLLDWELVHVKLDVVLSVICDKVSEEVRVNTVAGNELEVKLVVRLRCIPLWVKFAVFCALYSDFLPALLRILIGLKVIIEYDVNVCLLVYWVSSIVASVEDLELRFIKDVILDL